MVTVGTLDSRTKTTNPAAYFTFVSPAQPTPHSEEPERFFAVSRGLTGQIKFASDKVDDGGEVAVGAVASGLGFGGLDEAVNAFKDAIVDLGGKPAEESCLVAADGFGDGNNGFNAAVSCPEIPFLEVGVRQL